jgi:glycosyltransferase involved in cell wall biosynthesis
MNDLLLSIVIPAYNAIEYISDCLHSVFGQVDQRVEVILIDDGSTDGTMDLVISKFASYIECNKLILISQANSGPGAARNRGLDRACGRYITFLDSDDLLLDNYFCEIIPILEMDKFDIIEHGFLRFHSKEDLHKSIYKPLYNYTGAYNLQEIRNTVFSKTVWYPSIRIYKNVIWSGLLFPEGVFYEDAMIIHRIFLRNYYIYYTNRPFLGYRYNPDSTTSNHSSAHMLDLINLYRSLAKDNVATLIFKIRLARSILYFHHEVGSNKSILNDILLDINSTPRYINLLRNLKMVDIFFLLFTNFYIFIDKLRFKYRNKYNDT